MMFDLHYDCEFDDGIVQKLQDDLDVAISIKPKAKQANKSVIIKAQVGTYYSISMRMASLSARAPLLLEGAGLHRQLSKWLICRLWSLARSSDSSALTDKRVNHMGIVLK